MFAALREDVSGRWGGCGTSGCDLRMWPESGAGVFPVTFLNLEEEEEEEEEEELVGCGWLD